jgi:tetratricopeptide (TPR) repeat protein
VLAKDPLHAPTLNYLGYMLADRGERIDEAVGYIKRALAADPYNAAYLDSLGWAYFRQNKLDLAEENLSKAAAQRGRDSAVQDHYGDLLFKLGRYQDAVSAWQRALDGDGEQIDRGAIDKKLGSAREKLRKH